MKRQRNEQIDLILYQMDAFTHEYSSRDISTCLDLKFEREFSIIPEKLKTSYAKANKVWEEWGKIVHEKIEEVRRNVPKRTVKCFVGKAPIPMFIYLGVQCSQLSNVFVINERPEKKSWEIWQIDNVEEQSNGASIFKINLPEQRREDVDKVVLFLSLDPTNYLKPSLKQSILGIVGDKGTEFLEMIYCPPLGEDPTKRLDAAPQHASQIKREMKTNLRKIKFFFQSSRIMIASALPAPLNVILGTLLNNTLGSVTLLEKTGEKYEVAFEKLFA